MEEVTHTLEVKWFVVTSREENLTACSSVHINFDQMLV